MRPEPMSVLAAMSPADRAQAIQAMRVALLIEQVFSATASRVRRAWKTLSGQH